MNVRAVVLIAAILLLGGMDAVAQQGTFGIRGRRWMAEIEGDVKTEDSSGNIDVDSTLGLSEKETFLEAHVQLGLPLLGELNFQYLTGDFSGSRTLSQDITFGGTTFSQNTTIEAELDVESYTLLWRLGVSAPGLLGGSTGLGFLGGVKYLDFEASVRDNAGNSGSGDVQVPLPVLGAYGRLNLTQYLSLEAQIHGLRLVNIRKVSGKLFDATVSVDFRFQMFFAGVGYRLYHIDFEDESGDVIDQIEADLDLKGIFFEIGLSF